MKDDREIELEKLEIEKRKLEIEKLKIKEGLTRTILILLLTVGAGIGTLAKSVGISKNWYELIFIGLVLIFMFFSLGFLRLLFSIRKKLKEIK